MAHNHQTRIYETHPTTILGFDKRELRKAAKKHCKVCKGMGMSADTFRDLRGYIVSTPLVPCDCTDKT